MKPPSQNEVTVDIAFKLTINRRSATEEMLSHLFLNHYKRRAKPESATTRRVRIKQYL